MSATTVSPVQTFEYDLHDYANPIEFGVATTIDAVGGFGVYGSVGQMWDVTNFGNILGPVGLALETTSTLVNQQGGTIAGGWIGVELGLAGTGTGGGSLTNNVDATIAGSSGVVASGAAATITNSGMIAGNLSNPALVQNGQTISLGNGIFAGSGATVLNLAGGTVSGVFDGVRISGAGAVTNGGTISSASGFAVNLSNGGTVTNQGSASIGGAAGGVIVTGGSGIVNNAGSISSSGGGEAIILNAGGAINNTFGGTIGSGGATGNAIRIAGSAGAVTNGGMIAGGIQFTGSGASSLALQTGSFISGAIVGSTAPGATTGLVLQGFGRANNDFTNFDTLSVQASGTWTLGGNSSIATTMVSSGTLQVTGALVSAVTIAAGATARFDSNFQGNVTFQGTATLALAQTYGGTLSGFGVSDVIDLTSLPYASNDTLRVVAGNVLEIDSPGGIPLASLRFGVRTTLVAPRFSLSTDTVRGTLLTLSTMAAPALSITTAGSLTSSAQQTISGTIDAADAGLTISLYDGPTLLGTTTANASGAWSKTVTLPKQGANAITAKATDAAGNTGTSATVTYSLDSVAPTLAITNAGGLTNIAAQTISGTIDVADAGLTITLYDGATLLGTTTANASGAWSKTVTLPNQGANAITARATDAAGNTGTSATVTYTLDTIPPTLAVTSAGGLTNKAAQTISGTIDVADAGLTITLYDGLTLLGTATANASGVWSKTVTLPNQGANVIAAKATDAAGNTGTSAAVTYTLKSAAAAVDDFNADKKSDILFRNASGVTYLFTMNAATVAAGATTSIQAGTNWQIKGIADFNGDGASDLLWVYNNASNTSDALNGVSYVSFQNGVSATGGGVVQQLPAIWQVVGTGDFNGDGMADVLYRNSSTGQSYLDIMDGSSVNWAASGFTSQQVTNPNWSVAAVADFNGDGDADVLWRYNNSSNASDPLNGTLYQWLMNGTTVTSAALLSQQAGKNWQVAGTGDFNGDGTADILFRYANAANASDMLNGFTFIDFMNGATVTSGTPTQWQVDNAWAIASIGDYNGDGMSDILLQQTSSGNTYIWQMNRANVTSGAFTTQQAGTGWTVQNGVLIG